MFIFCCDLYGTCWSMEHKGEELGLQPGDIICLSPQEDGKYSMMWWENINGSEDNPILITNPTGSYGWKFENSKHFIISGNGSSEHEYDIKVSTTTGFYFTITKRQLTLPSPPFGYAFGPNNELLLSDGPNEYAIIDNEIIPLKCDLLIEGSYFD